MNRAAYILFLLAASLALQAQNGQFSQYYSSAVLVNPAFAGNDPYLAARLNYNTSKLASDGSLHDLSQVTLSYPVYQDKSRENQVGGAGLTFFRESLGMQGAFTSQKLLLTGAYAINLDQHKTKNLIFGIQGGLTQNRIAMDGLQWGSQYNAYVGFDNSMDAEDLGNLSSYYPVFNFGLIYTSKAKESDLTSNRAFHVGLSADNLNSPRSSFDGMQPGTSPLIFKLITTTNYAMNAQTVIHPSVLAIYSTQSYQLNLGSYISHQLKGGSLQSDFMLQAGAWYRVMDAFIFLTGVKIKDLSLGISYDLNAKNFGENIIYQQINPAVEVSIGYNIKLSGKVFDINAPLF